MTYDTWKTTEPAVDEWDEAGCKWCRGLECAECGFGACWHEWPCSAWCESVAEVARLDRRIEVIGTIELPAACRLRDQYRAEGDTRTQRLADVKARIVALHEEREALIELQDRHRHAAE